MQRSSTCDVAQFAHLDWAARQPSSQRRRIVSASGTSRGRGWSAADILREAARCAGHCSHVAAPQPPEIIHGVAPLEVERITLDWAASVTQANGKALRSDAPVLACGVISLPGSMSAVWSAFCADAVAELERQFGDRLRSVVAHRDERHPHLHFYVVPQPGEAFDLVHPGYAASRTARRQGTPSQRTAYVQAMRAWLDVLHERLGRPYGLARTGPRRRRLSRLEWKIADGEHQLRAAEARYVQQIQAFQRQLAVMREEATMLNGQAQQTAAQLLRAAEDEVESRQAAARRRLEAQEQLMAADRRRVAQALALLERDKDAELAVLRERDAWRVQHDRQRSKRARLLDRLLRYRRDNRVLLREQARLNAAHHEALNLLQTMRTALERHGEFGLSDQLHAILATRAPVRRTSGQ